MKIDCTKCGSEVNLDHKVFEDYEGPIKCFCCGTMMEVRTEGGIISAAGSSGILPAHLKDLAVEPAL